MVVFSFSKGIKSVEERSNYTINFFQPNHSWEKSVSALLLITEIKFNDWVFIQSRFYAYPTKIPTWSDFDEVR